MFTVWKSSSVIVDKLTLQTAVCWVIDWLSCGVCWDQLVVFHVVSELRFGPGCFLVEQRTRKTKQKKFQKQKKNTRKEGRGKNLWWMNHKPKFELPNSFDALSFIFAKPNFRNSADCTTKQTIRLKITQNHFTTNKKKKRKKIQRKTQTHRVCENRSCQINLSFSLFWILQSNLSFSLFWILQSNLSCSLFWILQINLFCFRKRDIVSRLRQTWRLFLWLVVCLFHSLNSNKVGLSSCRTRRGSWF